MPLSIVSYENLTAEEVYEIFKTTTSKRRNEISRSPPVLPREGQMFLFSLGTNESLWDVNKKKFR